MKKSILILIFLLSASYGKTLVLLYHSFSPSPISNTSINPEYFRAHIRELKSEGYRIIDINKALTNFLSGDTSRIPEALITIDDGWASVYKHAFPILQEEDVKATIFIYPRAVSRYDGFLTWEQIQKMLASGYVDIGSHGMSHTPLKREFIKRKLYYSWFVEGELVGSKESIEFHIGKPIFAIAYPMGYYSDYVLEAARKAGYLLGFTTENPLETNYKGRLAIPRYTISRKDKSIRELLRLFKHKYKLEVSVQRLPSIKPPSKPEPLPTLLTRQTNSNIIKNKNLTLSFTLLEIIKYGNQSRCLRVELP
ncbi:MAG: polysaccharide deacetylase family protein [bacterium]